MRGRLAAGVAAGIVLVLAALAFVLTRSEPRLTGSNTRVAASGIELGIAPGEQRCQRREFVPAGTEDVQVFARTSGRPRGDFSITVRAPSGTTAVGRGSAGRRDRPRKVAIARVRRDLHDATVCIRSHDADLRLAGNLTPYRSYATGAGTANPGEPGDVVRLDYFRHEPQSWLQILPDVADRVWLFKGPFRGPAALWAMGLLLALAWAGSLWVLLREDVDAGR